MKNLITSLKLVAFTMLICCILYPLGILTFAQIASPATAQGSLLFDAKGTCIGSRLIAQNFASERYFWPRPSAVDFKADAAGGSNLSPTSPKLTERAAGLIQQYGATEKNPLPADLATASGSGLDPHITLLAAQYQVPRVAAARGVPEEKIQVLLEQLAFQSGGRLCSERIINVLELNLALDQLTTRP